MPDRAEKKQRGGQREEAERHSQGRGRRRWRVPLVSSLFYSLLLRVCTCVLFVMTIERAPLIKFIQKKRKKGNNNNRGEVSICVLLLAIVFSYVFSSLTLFYYRYRTCLGSNMQYVFPLKIEGCKFYHLFLTLFPPPL